MNLAQLFRSDAAAIERFKLILAGSPTQRGKMTREMETGCQQLLQELQLAPLPGLSASESVLFRLEQLRSQPPQVIAAVAQATGGILGDAAEIQERVRELDQTLQQDGRVLLDKMLTEAGIEPAQAVDYLNLTAKGIEPEKARVQAGIDPPPEVPEPEPKSIEEALARGLDKAEAAAAGLLPKAKAAPAKPAPPPLPENASRRDHIARAMEHPKALPASVELPKPRSSKPIYFERGQEWEMALEYAARETAGESIDDIDASPELRAQQYRETAQALRAKAGREDDPWNSALGHAWDRSAAASEGALADFDAQTQTDLEEASRLESMAEEESRMEE